MQAIQLAVGILEIESPVSESNNKGTIKDEDEGKGNAYKIEEIQRKHPIESDENELQSKKTKTTLQEDVNPQDTNLQDIDLQNVDLHHVASPKQQPSKQVTPEHQQTPKHQATTAIRGRSEHKLFDPPIEYQGEDDDSDIDSLQQEVDCDDWEVYEGLERTFISGDDSQLVVIEYGTANNYPLENSSKSDSSYSPSVSPIQEALLDRSHENAISDAFDIWGQNRDPEGIELDLNEHFDTTKCRSYRETSESEEDLSEEDLLPGEWEALEKLGLGQGDEELVDVVTLSDEEEETEDDSNSNGSQLDYSLEDAAKDWERMLRLKETTHVWMDSMLKVAKATGDDQHYDCTQPQLLV